jgi:6-phosphogluconolactonase
MRQKWAMRVAAIAALASMLGLTACGNFFVCQKASCPAGSSTVDYVYATNSASGSTYLSAYTISSSGLTTLSGFPVALGFQPSAIAIAANNDFLYIATSTLVYAYAVTTSTGAIAVTNSGAAAASSTGLIAAMTVSPDGNWLYTLDSSGTVLSQYAITVSTGALTLTQTITTPGTGCSALVPCALTVSKSEELVAATLGTAGDVIFPYNSTSGITSSGYNQIQTGSASVGDYALAFDSNNYLYLARTTGEVVYSLNSSGAGNAVAGSPFAAGTSPRAVLVTNDGAYSYNASYSAGTVYAFSIQSGVLTAQNTPFYSTQANVSALAEDSTSTYLVTAGYAASSGLRLYSISSSGALTAVGTTQPTGTTLGVPMLLAVTH